MSHSPRVLSARHMVHAPTKFNLISHFRSWPPILNMGSCSTGSYAAMLDIEDHHQVIKRFIPGASRNAAVNRAKAAQRQGVKPLNISLSPSGSLPTLVAASQSTSLPVTK